MVAALPNDLQFTQTYRRYLFAIPNPSYGESVQHLHLPHLTCLVPQGGRELNDASGSVYNTEEANLVLCIIEQLIAKYGLSGPDIGVICLYQAQRVRLSSSIDALPETCSWRDQAQQIQISTVDAFQGAEKKLIILSTSKTSRSGFLESEQRLNVALTRGKSAMQFPSRRSHFACG